MARAKWQERWRALASRERTGDPESGEQEMVERWRSVARRLDDGSEARADVHLDFVLDQLDAETTVLDIGAAIGRWAVPLAQRAQRVTAVEPVPPMARVLGERLAARGLSNVEIVESPWMDATVPTHDIVVAVHSMYTSPDIVAFARKMEVSASRLCGMALRIPAHDGILGELSELISGEWHDSPNFVVAYNALLEAGIVPHVFVEPVARRQWTDPSVADAASRARRHLRIEDDRFDPLITETLERRLTQTDAGYGWPDCMRSAFVWWEPPAG